MGPPNIVTRCLLHLTDDLYGVAFEFPLPSPPSLQHFSKERVSRYIKRIHFRHRLHHTSVVCGVSHMDLCVHGRCCMHTIGSHLATYFRYHPLHNTVQQICVVTKEYNHLILQLFLDTLMHSECSWADWYDRTKIWGHYLFSFVVTFSFLCLSVCHQVSGYQPMHLPIVTSCHRHSSLF